MQVELIDKDGSKYVSSRELARLLQKQHKHVLAKIRKNWLEWVSEGVLFDRTGKKTNFALLSIDRAVSLLDRSQQNDLVAELRLAVKLGLADPSQQPEGKVENAWSAAVVAGDRQISCSASEDLQSH